MKNPGDINQYSIKLVRDTRIEQACNRVLFTENEGAQYFCEFKLDNLLRGDQKTRYECYQIGIDKGFLSRNDVRGFENLSPVPGGDDYGINNPAT